MKNSKNFLLTIFCSAIFFLGYLIFLSDSSTKKKLYFSPANLPLIEVDIENNPYLVGIDLGSKFPLSILDTDLKDLTKSFYKMVNSSDMFGNTYSYKGYIIPGIKIGKMKWKNLLVSEKKEAFINNTTIYCDNKKCKKSSYFGFLGRPLLEKVNLYFDFQNEFLLICKNEQVLIKNGINLTKFIKIPFKKSELGIILKIETDLGIKQFILDTGTTINCLRLSQLQNIHLKKDPNIKGLTFFCSKKFIIGGIDFGEEELYGIKIISSLNNIDGFIGMRFLKKYKIYIDYQNSNLYIAK